MKMFTFDSLILVEFLSKLLSGHSIFFVNGKLFFWLDKKKIKREKKQGAKEEDELKKKPRHVA